MRQRKKAESLNLFEKGFDMATSLAFEKTKKVVDSCKTIPQLMVAYKFFNLACKHKESKKLDARDYWNSVEVLEKHIADKASALRRKYHGTS